MLIDYLKTLFNQPNYLIIYPTSRCNARCPHCYNAKNIQQALLGKRKELTLKEYEKISQNFKHLYALSISGGEPTLRLDLPQICQLFYQNSHTRYIGLSSNGYFTNRLKTIVQTILKQNPRVHLSVCLSVDALGKKHDDFRKLKNGFDKVMASFKMLKNLKKIYKHRLIIKSSTSYTASTQDTFLETMQFLQRQGIEAGSAFIRGIPRKKKEKEVNINQYLKAMKTLKSGQKSTYSFWSKAFWFKQISSLLPEIVLKTYRKKTQIYPCKAGKSLLVLWDNGDVSPCETLGVTFGNIRNHNYNLKKILITPKAKTILTSIKQKKCHCTWENMLVVNSLKSAKFYPKLLAQLFNI